MLSAQIYYVIINISRYKWYIPLSYETATKNDGEIYWLNMDNRKKNTK